MMNFLLVALGGGVGAALRYGVGQGVARLAPDCGWPTATLTVNLVGSFAMGALIGWMLQSDKTADDPVRFLLATGLLGGFTTFSAFSIEMLTLIQKGAILRAVAYASLSVLLGLALCALGYTLARRVFL